MTSKEERSKWYFERITTANIESLKSFYSPMFDMHFHEMTDEQIKKQLDYWVENEYPEHKDIFEERKPLTKEQRENNYKRFVKGIK